MRLGPLDYMKNRFHQLNQTFPIRLMLILIGIWLVLVPVYKHVLYPIGLDVPKIFPISVLYPTRFTAVNIPYLLLFLLLLGFAIWRLDRIKAFFLLLICILIIITGNLIGGGYEAAFLRPFNDQSQYYYDTLTVPGWKDWLAAFNVNQVNLSVHGRTHPPFAVLIHHLFLFPFNFNLNILAAGLSLISLSTLPMLYLILNMYEIDERKLKLLMLLFAVIPAVNIYSVVSLDGVILAGSTMFLLGLVILLKKPASWISGFLLMTIGFCFTNMLTFSGLFLGGVGGLISLCELIINKRAKLMIGMVLTLLTFSLLLFVLAEYFQYNHLQAFSLASKLESSGGFRLFTDPINYLLTRFEDISELLFFLSFPLFALFIKSKPYNFSPDRINLQDTNFLFIVGSIVIFLMFLTGAYRTGETARTCLFIYPFFLLQLTKTDESIIKMAVMQVAIQTVIMQAVASYYW